MLSNNTTKAPTFPIIDFYDLENRFEIIAEQVLEACKNVGFFGIVNHSGPTSAQFDQVYEMGKQFFEQPIEKKVPYGRTEMKSRGGYFSLTPHKCDNWGK
ncbi:hypothetical protein INT45_009915 [Circinella minor]|uniref:Non-haem dioxygenase N-terminal domain-containing protein n=1 Tax=Circinella minor TaxID=1195481 RepID=A0A8H7VDF6_9FUNG|nr:hypothetical protein INT45_009915 [Circinella minor]